MLAALPSLDALFVQAQNISRDDLGNIYNDAGFHIGAVPGSAADIGSGGTTGWALGSPPSSAGASTSSQASTSSAGAASTGPISATVNVGKKVVGSLAQLESWAAGIVTRAGEDDHAGVSLEDIIFIILGVLLIAAAVFSFVFTFKETQNVVKGGVKAARGAIDAKVAAALAV